MDGEWRTDLTATPRLNRAVRDWTLSYLTALHGYGIDAACAFSMEVQHGDPSATAGIAQMGPLGDPVLLPTPSLQTNFSPTSLAYWQEVYLEMAAIQSSAGMRSVSAVRRSPMVVFPHRQPADSGSRLSWHAVLRRLDDVAVPY